MGRPVEIADVVAQLDMFGELAVLVTVTSDCRPHVGTVLVGVADERLVVRVGARTREHIASNPAVTLSWARPDLDHQLIVDGTTNVDGTPDAEGLWAVEIAVGQAILHRLAGRPDAGPTCQPLPLVR